MVTLPSQAWSNQELSEGLDHIIAGMRAELPDDIEVLKAHGFPWMEHVIFSLNEDEASMLPYQPVKNHSLSNIVSS